MKIAPATVELTEEEIMIGVSMFLEKHGWRRPRGTTGDSPMRDHIILEMTDDKQMRATCTVVANDSPTEKNN